jgi:general secretion pathway protein D
MNQTSFRQVRPGLFTLSALACACLLAGCAAQLQHREAMDLLAKGKSVEAIEGLHRASALEPDNAAYRIDYLTQRQSAVEALIAAAEADRDGGQFDQAALRYKEAARVEPGNERVRTGLLGLDSERRIAAQLLVVDRLLQGNQTEQALEQLRRVLKEDPRHERALALQRALEEKVAVDRQAREEQLSARAAFRRPVTLQFRDVPLRMVFEAISKAGNVNVIVDRDVKADLRTTIFVKDASIEDTLDVILIQNQLEKRVLSGNTLLIYPATATKQKELAELKVRTFQLTNVDVAFMASIVKTMVKTKDIVTDAKSNTLVMRDTPEAILLAERLIAANDLPDAEVMLEVEVLEVSSVRASEIGLKLPSTFTLGTPSPASGGTLTLGDLRALTRNALTATPLSATLNLMMKDSDTNILASPRIRSRSKEKARILVGDKLPVITNLISPQQSGQNSVVTGSIQYVEVGIKLEVEPQVYADGDVGLKINLEVSNVTDTIQTESGRAYQIGTRSASTSVRLHDGETQVMAGLIDDHDRNSAAKVPGIGQMPVLGRLFSNTTGDSKKSEIVLSITPHIIRAQAVADPRFADAWSGTDSNVRDSALRLEPLSVVRLSTPAPTAAARPAPAALPTPAAAPSGAPPAGATTAPPESASRMPTMSNFPAVQPRPLPGGRPLAAPAPAVPSEPAAEPAADPAAGDKARP